MFLVPTSSIVFLGDCCQYPRVNWSRLHEEVMTALKSTTFPTKKILIQRSIKVNTTMYDVVGQEGTCRLARVGGVKVLENPYAVCRQENRFLEMPYRLHV
jgi:hypothetical protein